VIGIDSQFVFRPLLSFFRVLTNWNHRLETLQRRSPNGDPNRFNCRLRTGDVVDMESREYQRIGISLRRNRGICSRFLTRPNYVLYSLEEVFIKNKECIYYSK